eukprot:m.149067 g.149067  ORF g.149067 m.149067 type:complete len:430 (-) comp15066_c0_seq1:24-1313(-)
MDTTTTDVCHAYQILHHNGVPDERIVVMMYDDIASSVQNPVRGKIFNEPNGPDVYAGVPKDYTKHEVTPKVFLDVLSGNAAALKKVGSGKYINSTAADRVFVFFADHGAPGILAFPTWDIFFEHALHAEDLLKTLEDMHTAHKYNQMVLYIEACESGSMFNGLLPSNTSIYAVTAATPYESSYACYYDSRVRTYLGDCFSNHWMEDADTGLIHTETLQQQWARVRNATNTSVVCQYGDLSFANSTPVASFIAEGPARQAAHKARSLPSDAVASRDIVIGTLRQRLAHALPSERAALEAALAGELAARQHIDHIFAPLVKASLAIIANTSCNQSECYQECVNAGMLTPDECYNQCCTGQTSCYSPSGRSDARGASRCMTGLLAHVAQACGAPVLTDYALRYARTAATVCGTALAEGAVAQIRAWCAANAI